MRILHIIDADGLGRAGKATTEFILGLAEAGANQGVVAERGLELGLLDGLELERFDIGKNGRADGFANRVRAFMLGFEFRPDIAIKWGAAARTVPLGERLLQISHVLEPKDLRGLARGDYVMTTSARMFSAAQEGGFSGAKSFLFPSAVYEHRGVAPITRRDLFIPERADAVFIGGNLASGRGFEPLFEALAGIPETYFIVSGTGPDEEKIKDFAQRVNIKSRCRFFPEIEKSRALMKLAKFAILPASGEEQALRITECRAGGCAVLAQDSPFAREHVRDGSDGFIMPAADVYLIRNRVRELLAMEADTLDAMAGHARNKAVLAPRVMPGYLAELEALHDRWRGRRKLLPSLR